MASSSSLGSATSALPQNRKHHVFPSFHGPDVRRTLLSHILKELKTKAIDAFVDDDMERSKSIGPLLKESIKGSRIAIVFLSKNYASSTWCLDELVEIIKCREDQLMSQIVIPLFHEVDPTDVKKQTGDFGKVFKETCQGKTKDAIRSWEHALAEVAKITGYHSKNWSSEAKMIEEIATEVSTMLNMSTPSSDFDDLVGMESHMIQMEQHLRLDLDEVRIIGILGTPGIGKTTLARFLFNQHSQDFQLTLFMDNIKRKYKIPADLSDDYTEKLSLQREFLSQLTNDKDIKITSLGSAKDRLNDKKVLIVLDDVDQAVQLEAMAGETSWFGPHSRIIVTTQDEKVLNQRKIKHIYKVDLPSPGDALQMFCMSAFLQKHPKDGFEELAREVTRLAGALPLGLSVLGSYFKEMTKEDWTKELPSLVTCLNEKIERILKFSYDALSADNKSVFLHIACFFNDELVDAVEGYLTNSPFFSHVTLRLRVLVEKSLISMDSGKIRMHNLLVQLGREIVRQQSVSEPGKRQFLYDEIEICEVFNDDQAGSSRVIGIDLKEDITCTSERAFERLSNLQFLRIIQRYRININPQSMNYISRKLRLLSWPSFEMTCFPPNFHTKFLVKLDMPHSKLETLWKGIQPLSNLKWVNLSHSRRLKELPDLSTATNLCELDLSYCFKLVELHSSIGNAINLQRLKLNCCTSLMEIPSSIEKLVNLESLDLSHCKNLVKIACSMENATKLCHLDFGFNGSASNELDSLSFGHCSSLVELPSSIGNAINLEYFDLSYCSSLVELPSWMKNLGRLKVLDLKGCSKLEVVLTNINLENLEELDLSDCSLLKSDPETSTNIDPWIGRISSLRQLDLRGVKNMVTLPQLPDSIVELVAENCESLERLDCTFQNPDILRLNFGNCFKLNQEAKDVIIQTRTNQYAVLPGEEVPVCFTYGSYGGSLTVDLNEKPLHISTNFKACIIFEGNQHRPDYGECGSDEYESDEYESDEGIEFPDYAECEYQSSGYEYGSDEEDLDLHICCSITSKQNPRTACISEKIPLASCFSEHLYIFEVEAVEVTSTALVFEFDTRNGKGKKMRNIKKCAVYQLQT